MTPKKFPAGAGKRFARTAALALLVAVVAGMFFVPAMASAPQQAPARENAGGWHDDTFVVTTPPGMHAEGMVNQTVLPYGYSEFRPI